MDLRDSVGQTAAGVTADDLACPWMALSDTGDEPPSCTLAGRLIADGVSGIIVPSFATGATSDDANLVLWRWTAIRPYQCTVHNPAARLPKNQLFWT